jgi:hypothetical protein
LAKSSPTDSIVRKLFALIARSYQMLNDTQEALRTCARGLELDPEDAELWFRKAVVHRHRGESTAAEQSWRRILGLRRANQFCSVDQGIYGHLTRRNLVSLAAERGNLAEVEQLWNDVLAECPGDGEALAQLARLRRRTRSEKSPWIIVGSERAIVPTLGPDDFDPYAPLAERWITALEARVVVALGVRFGAAARALLAGARGVDGQVWGVDPLERHDVLDERFTFIQSDPMEVSHRWERVDLLHVDVDAQCEDVARKWLRDYAGKCRAIAIHHSQHPGFRLGPVIAELVGAGQWRVFEYRGNFAGWSVLVRPGETCLEMGQPNVAGRNVAGLSEAGAA